MVEQSINMAELEQKYAALADGNAKLNANERAFLKKMGPAVEAAIKKAGLTVPVEGVLGQLALESASRDGQWGQSYLAQNANNYAGLTAGSSWSGPVINRPDKQGEKAGGVTINQDFRKYGSVQEFADDYVQFIQKPRYALALEQKDPYHYALELGKAGYHNDNDSTYAGYVEARAFKMSPDKEGEFKAVAAQYKDVGDQERARRISEKAKDYVSAAGTPEERKRREEEHEDFMRSMMEKNPVLGFFLMILSLIMGILTGERADRVFDFLDKNGVAVPDRNPGSGRGGASGGVDAEMNANPASNAKGLDSLHPAIKDRAKEFVAELERQGIPVVVTEGYRSPARQDALYAQGRTAPGNIVTGVRGGNSYHNHGVAFDICPVSCINKHNWDDSNPVWKKMGEIGKQFGFEWGGDWTKLCDQPHFQVKRSDFSISSLKSAPKIPGTEFPVIDESKLPKEFKEAKARASSKPEEAPKQQEAKPKEREKVGGAGDNAAVFDAAAEAAKIAAITFKEAGVTDKKPEKEMAEAVIASQIRNITDAPKDMQPKHGAPMAADQKENALA
jgi:peptidoglycan L-alanyl-D-glutamate endopeptidase CwlK